LADITFNRYGCGSLVAHNPPASLNFDVFGGIWLEIMEFFFVDRIPE
jgi:hypothetical protein